MRYEENWRKTNPSNRRVEYPPVNLKDAEERLKLAILRARRMWRVRAAYFTKKGTWKKRLRYVTEWRGDNAPSYLRKAAQA